MIGRYIDDLIFLLLNVFYIVDINIINGNLYSYRLVMIDFDLLDKG